MPTTSAAPVVSLQPFALQPPAVLSGIARGPDGAPLAGATIRAWEAYLARTPKNQAQAEEVRRYLTARGR